jgi:hypothetical protein
MLGYAGIDGEKMRDGTRYRLENDSPSDWLVDGVYCEARVFGFPTKQFTLLILNGQHLMIQRAREDSLLLSSHTTLLLTETERGEGKKARTISYSSSAKRRLDMQRASLLQ